MIIDNETRALLNGVFGEQLSAEEVADGKTLGFRSALGVVMAGQGFAGLHMAAVRVLIRTALCNGLGEVPFGWSLLPTDDDKHELAVWVFEAPVRAREVA